VATNIIGAPTDLTHIVNPRDKAIRFFVFRGETGVTSLAAISISSFAVAGFTAITAFMGVGIVF